MDNAHADLRRLRWLEAGATLYFLAAVGRLIYEGVGSRGIYGWLADEQMQRFGHFNLKLTLLGAALVYLLPIFFVTRHSKATRVRLAGTGALAPPPSAAREAVATARLFILLGLAFAAAGGIGYYILQRQNEANARRRVEPITLEAAEQLSTPALAGLKFVALGATCQTRAGYRSVESDARHITPDVHHRYLPLTRSNWHPGEPVRFFLQTTVDVYSPPYENGQPYLPRSYDDVPFAGSFEGELKRETLPSFAYSALQRGGLKIATPYYVLENNVYGGRPRIMSRQEMLLAPILGGFIGLIFFLAGTFMYWRRAGYAARIEARRG